MKPPKFEKFSYVIHKKKGVIGMIQGINRVRKYYFYDVQWNQDGEDGFIAKRTAENDLKPLGT